MKILIILISINFSIQLWLPDKPFSNEYTPMKSTNETLIQRFRCGSDSPLKELNYFKRFETKMSCNAVTYKKVDTNFNVTIDGSVQNLDLKNIDTFSVSLNGHLILMQIGMITDGICAGGKFNKLVFNKVDDNACDGKGVKLQRTLYASIKIDGGYCQAFCFGQVPVIFFPGITNT